MLSIGSFGSSSSTPAEAILQVARHAAPANPPPRLMKAAHEFEAQMMKELLEPLNAGDGLTGDDDAGSAGALGQFASEALGRAISAAGGLGIANRIVSNLAERGGISPEMPSH